MAQTLMQNMNWEALPVSTHQKFANIVIRRQLDLINNASTLARTQDTLGLATARATQMNFLNVQLARFLLHPMLRKKHQNEVVEQNGESMLIEGTVSFSFFFFVIF